MYAYRNTFIARIQFALAFFLVFAYPITASAYMEDVEASSDNVFAAATFDILLTEDELVETLGPGLTDEIDFSTILLNTSGALDPEYTVTAIPAAANTFCDALTVDVTHVGTPSYDGPLTSYEAPTTTTLGTWEFDIELDESRTDYAHGDTCEVAMTYDAWRADVGATDSGYFDEEVVNMEFTAHTVVLNEFLPDPDGVLCTDGSSSCAPGDPEFIFDFGSDSSAMPQGEWVELYNNSDFPTDLTGWYIEDAANNTVPVTAGNTAPAGTIIPANGWLVVYMSGAVLNNSGDTINLFDGDDTLIDTYTYSENDLCELEPTPEDPNATSGGGTGCGNGVPPNKSYARIPDGVGDFVDPVPTPGAFNTVTAEQLTREGWADDAIAAVKDSLIESKEKAPTSEAEDTEFSFVSDQPSAGGDESSGQTKEGDSKPTNSDDGEPSSNQSKEDGEDEVSESPEKSPQADSEADDSADNPAGAGDPAGQSDPTAKPEEDPETKPEEEVVTVDQTDATDDGDDDGDANDDEEAAPAPKKADEQSDEGVGDTKDAKSEFDSSKKAPVVESANTGSESPAPATESDPAAKPEETPAASDDTAVNQTE